MQGGSRSETLEYPDQQWFYYTMADRFGWTPDQVDNLPVETADWLIAIGDMVQEINAERAEQAGK